MQIYCSKMLELSRSGCSFSDLMAICEFVGSTTLAETWAVAEAGDLTNLADFTRWQAEQLPFILERVQSTLCDSMRDESRGRKVRREYAQALSKGLATKELAVAADFAAVYSYVVIVPIVADPAMRHDILLAAEAADGGDWGRVMICDGEPLPAVFLAVTDAAEWNGDAPAHRMTRVHRLYQALRKRLGNGWAIATAQADGPEAVPDALERARGIASVACNSSTCGVITEEMVPLDRAIASDEGLRDALCEVIAPLLPYPELTESLDLLYRFDLDRGRTAHALGIHRRTLVHRLRRISEKTHLHPVSSRGVAVLQVGLVAARAAGLLEFPKAPRAIRAKN
ncbi:helix-turn-helix domain-containing protein [Streptomyces albidus (ex Kaewkla and Franco 2022)]|uniref:helix-turn-helix domain-containing protein n=1 Tax=Streptomyces albidus (ex Kaewkla and Franco 2022) TaxID=722709 RepID=UPI0015EE5952|nr:helix-turn-helix domain-containing protein [Streptomyces albidus (ex Kaewkla and Franco 2022)]